MKVDFLFNFFCNHGITRISLDELAKFRLATLNDQYKCLTEENVYKEKLKILSILRSETKVHRTYEVNNGLTELILYID